MELALLYSYKQLHLPVCYPVVTAYASVISTSWLCIHTQRPSFTTFHCIRHICKVWPVWWSKVSAELGIYNSELKAWKGDATSSGSSCALAPQAVEALEGLHRSPSRQPVPYWRTLHINSLLPITVHVTPFRVTDWPCV